MPFELPGEFEYFDKVFEETEEDKGFIGWLRGKRVYNK